MSFARVNVLIFALVLAVYVAGQVLIGTYDTVTGQFVFNAPADVDFLYYGAIANQLFTFFPPENPAFAGVELTQPYLQFLPAALLAPAVNPYNAIRLLNVLYLVLFGLLLWRLFPERWGLSLVILFAASSWPVAINALGVDLIARGFTHAPFFLLLTVALFGSNRWVRLLAIFLAALVNGYLMLMVLLYLAVWLVFRRQRDTFLLLLSGGIGLALAGLLVTSAVVARPVYFLFTEAFHFDPREMLIHAAPMAIMACFVRQGRMTLLLVVAVLFGSFIHYNPFFPVFMVYYAGAMILVAGKWRPTAARWVVAVLTAVMFVSFLQFTYEKYRPDRGDYYPCRDHRLDAALTWITQHTDPREVFLAITPDSKDLALVMQHRPVYFGYAGHVSHLGLSWRRRADSTVQTFSVGAVPDEVDYIFYGPVEQKYFPAADLPHRVAYRDQHVVIYEAP